jgi:hypothetical protein
MLATELEALENTNYLLNEKMKMEILLEMLKRIQ